MGKKITITINEEPSTFQRNENDVLACYIIDASSSMSSLRQQAISGFNEWLETVKRNRSVTHVSLTIFNTEVENVYNVTPINQVQPLTEATYNPNGWTALHDAIVETVLRAETEARNLGFRKSLVIIMTDGQENSSKRYRIYDVKNLIERKQREGNWTFTFLGATPDAFNVGASFGIPKGNTLRYEVEATQDIFGALASNTVSYASSRGLESKSFLKNVSASGELKGEYRDDDSDDEVNTSGTPRNINMRTPRSLKATM